MSLSFVSSAVLLSIDGALHNERPLKNKVKLVWVRQECKPRFARNSCPIERENKPNKRNAIVLFEGDLGSRKGLCYVDLNKNRLRAHRQQVAAQEALKKGRDGALI
jgi:hypothetical protein